MAVRLKDRGERWTVARIRHILRDNSIGDDCAAIPWGPDYLLATADALSAGTHFPTPDPLLWGHMAAAVNLSDIACKGGTPVGVLLSYVLPGKTPVTLVDRITRGARDCCLKCSTRIIGGDTKEGPAICIAGTAIGRVPRREFMPRVGARPGDLLALTGEAGGPAAGYLKVKSGKYRRGDSDVLRLIKPWPRLREGAAAAHTREVRACTDLSDGLSASVWQMCAPGNVGAQIEWNAIPVSRGIDCATHSAEECVFDFGGEYELLMAVRASGWEKVKAAVEGTGTHLTAIGRVTRDRRIVSVRDGKTRTLVYGGWEHFRRHR